MGLNMGGIQYQSMDRCKFLNLDPHVLPGAGDIDWFNAKRQLLGVVMHQGGRLDVQARLGWAGCEGTAWSPRQVARFLINPAGEQVRIWLIWRAQASHNHLGIR